MKVSRVCFFSHLLTRKRTKIRPVWYIVLIFFVIVYIVFCSHNMLTRQQHTMHSISVNHTQSMEHSHRKSISNLTLNNILPKSHHCNKTFFLDKYIQRIEELKFQVKNMRKSGTIMSRNLTAVSLTTRLQNITRSFLLCKYGQNPYIVEMKIRFPQLMITENNISKITRIISIELAPIDYLPYAVFTFLEIVRTFKSGSFHRNAGHVLQSEVKADFKGGVVYMEFDRRYPHVEYTMGFAGRGGGNAFYINIVDNTLNHGPGTDRGGKDPEADTPFGRIVAGHDVVELMKKQKGTGKMGFVKNNDYIIRIESLRLAATGEETDCGCGSQ